MKNIYTRMSSAQWQVGLRSALAEVDSIEVTKIVAITRIEAKIRVPVKKRAVSKMKMLCFSGNNKPNSTSFTHTSLCLASCKSSLLFKIRDVKIKIMSR